ncbi:uncharacterized protein HMPREF1541_03425 [Cyphellophora europaea CBS 101466]|uniref:histidine kinase n=1 Tax=Cyphellophora europaea (strain CBS 101466) TaxID=1220924 RepID=W2S0M5_CYPE1|nr:uncharacterized protein HMPREF1541_03425 [Cyphellophora europaea CBS 101466]ETN41489.1 hypothetical protein HMPREF1541_03425 [Cyphellophora europaea CBS 101466]
MSRTEAKREALRVREARKYRPTQSPSGRQTRDVALHAMLQLIPWRLSVARALVSLIDKDLQFTIAESTKTSDIEGVRPPSDPGDELWLGCQGSLSREDTLCQYTMAVEAPLHGYAVFQVADLMHEPRFQHIPAVCNPPHLRFYAGTPLVSPQGIRVGTLCVLDEQPHPLLTDDEQNFLGLMATSLMRHLDSEIEMQLHSRYTKMSRGLADLVTRESAYLGDQNLDEEDETMSVEAVESPDDSDQSWNLDSKEPPPPPSTFGSGPRTYRKVFTTAADILRQSLDSDLAILAENFTDLRSWSTSQELRLGVSYSAGKRPFMDAVLSYQHPEDIIKTLCHRWPLGKIWIRDDNRNFLGIDDDRFRPANMPRDQRRGSIRSNDSQPDAEECEWLNNWLPKAEQVIFVPLWDPLTTDEPSACFITSHKSAPQFTAQAEVPFIRAFLNSLSVVCGHLTMRLAEQQKDQLLSSISHELRSPLHGIIASVEMLSATDLSQSQYELCDSIDVCSQTLLDTMSLVMDHAMVNSFVEGRSKNPFRENAGPTVHPGSSLHLESTCNLAAICEEGIDITKTAYVNLAKSTGVQRTDEEPVEVDFRASRADWTFICSPGIIRRLVMNLVSNSMKYTTAGSIQIELTQDTNDNLGTEDDSTTIVLTVSDTGQGMSSAFMKNGLFVPFSQESTLAPGLGLGLSIVRASVASLGGRIHVESGQNRGTTITVKFPARRPLYGYEAEYSKHDPIELRALQQPSGKTYRKFGPTLARSFRHAETLGVYLKDWWLYQRVDDTTTKVDWTFVDERDLDLELPPSRSLIVLTHSPLTDALLKTRNSTYTYLKVPFGPKALSKALQMATPGRRISSSSSINEGVSKLQLSLPSHGEFPFPTKQPVTTPAPEPPSQLAQSEMSSRPNTLTLRALTSANIGVASPDSPIHQHRTKRSTDYFSPLIHSHSDAAVTTTSSPALRSVSVLCVDDNPINLRLLQTYCTKLGFSRVATATDGFEAVQAVKEAAEPGDPPHGSQPFDVIFMDLTMPGCDGFEATRQIRWFERERRVLVLDGGSGGAGAAAADDEDGNITPTTAAEAEADKSVTNLQPWASPEDEHETAGHGTRTPPSAPTASTASTTAVGAAVAAAVAANIAPLRSTTVIAITALASEADQKKAFAAGIDHFVTKPLRFKDLKALMGDLGVI